MDSFEVGDVVREAEGSFYHHNLIMKVIGPSISPMRVRCIWIYDGHILSDSSLKFQIEKTTLDEATFLQWLECGII